MPVVEFLYQHYPETLNVATVGGATPCWIATSTNCPAVVRFCVAHGVDLNAVRLLFPPSSPSLSSHASCPFAGSSSAHRESFRILFVMLMMLGLLPNGVMVTALARNPRFRAAQLKRSGFRTSAVLPRCACSPRAPTIKQAGFWRLFRSSSPSIRSFRCSLLLYAAMKSFAKILAWTKGTRKHKTNR